MRRGVSVSIDGQHRNVWLSVRRFRVTPNGSWTIRRHSWSVAATDRLGNARTYNGSFGITAPLVRMPAGWGGLSIRPYRVAVYRFILGGFTGHRHVRNSSKMGRLRWTRWTQSDAWATGALWQLVCRPDCARGYYDPVRATAHVYRCNGQYIFTRITVYYRRHTWTLNASHSGTSWYWM